LYIPSVEGRPAEQFPLPREADFDELYAWLEPIAHYEKRRKAE
jgi:hypothetical protein